MPISRVDGRSQPGRGIPLLARLYKGDARDEANPRQTPKELPYFRVEFEPAYRHLAAPFAEFCNTTQPADLYGLYLVGETPEQAFDPFMERWGASGLITRCTGETIIDQLDGATGRVERGVMTACPNPHMEADTPPCGCKQVGRLGFVIPEFVRYSGVVGSFTVATHGWTDIMQMSGLLRDVYELTGTLKGVPFSLHRVPKEIEIPFKDKTTGEMRRSKTTKHMVVLRVMDGGLNLLNGGDAQHERQLPEPTPIRRDAPALPAATKETVMAGAVFANSSAFGQFVKAMQQEYDGITSSQIVKAFGRPWGEVTGTVDDAAELVRQYVRAN